MLLALCELYLKPDFCILVFNNIFGYVAQKRTFSVQGPKLSTDTKMYILVMLSCRRLQWRSNILVYFVARRSINTFIILHIGQVLKPSLLHIWFRNIVMSCRRPTCLLLWGLLLFFQPSVGILLVNIRRVSSHEIRVMEPFLLRLVQYIYPSKSSYILLRR